MAWVQVVCAYNIRKDYLRPKWEGVKRVQIH